MAIKVTIFKCELVMSDLARFKQTLGLAVS
jgi:hypothetical protein